MKLSKTILSMLMVLTILVASFSSLQISVGAVSGSDYTDNEYVAARIDAILEEFPEGSYFSYTGKACKCHSSGCSYSGGCDCISVYHDPETGKDIKLKSVQCMGFARYAFYKIFGHLDRDNSKYYSVGSLSSSKMTVSNVKALIRKAKTGAHIRANGRHSMILLDSDSSGLTVLHANSTGRCQVSIYTMTWSKFVSLYKSSGIDYVNMPKTYPDSDKENPGQSSEPTPSDPDIGTSNPGDSGNDSDSPETFVIGDADGNGGIDSNDALLVMQHAIGVISDDEIILEASDVNEDEIIDTNDSLLILKYSIGIIDKFE